MSLRVSVFSPVKNEVDFIGYSVMSVLPYVDEILYGVAPSNDGTEELLEHIQRKYAGDKLKVFWGHSNGEPIWDFDPLNMQTYNAAYNYLIDQAKGEALWFLHPDMVVTNPEAISGLQEGPLAWWTNISSYAGNRQTRISGRAGRWKNIHAKKFGIHYYGSYGSQNEDMYFSEITGKSYRHYGDEFDEYPYEIADSGIAVNHYCELKAYARRLEKMKLCLTTQMPGTPQERIMELAAHHPRVTLEPTSARFGKFSFDQATDPEPDVFAKYKDEFGPFRRAVKTPEGELAGAD